jgi:hypothetical protein
MRRHCSDAATQAVETLIIRFVDFTSKTATYRTDRKVLACSGAFLGAFFFSLLSPASLKPQTPLPFFYVTSYLHLRKVAGATRQTIIMAKNYIDWETWLKAVFNAVLGMSKTTICASRGVWLQNT